MPHSSGKKKYTKAEQTAIAREKKPNVSHLKKAIKRGKFSPASTSEAERLRLATRIRVDKAVTGRRSYPTTQPTQKPSSSAIGRLTGVLTGNTRIGDALTGEGEFKRKKKR
jgi:hypothetical protein